MTIQQKIDVRIVRARTMLVVRQPFYGTLALYMIVVEDPSVETMAVDGTHLFYAPAFLDELVAEARRRGLPDDELIIGVIAHEVMHCAYRHHTRRADRDLEMWNEAGDYAINRDLLKVPFHLPESLLLDTRFDGMSAEEIYRHLDAEKQQQQQQGKQQQPQQGAGSSPQQGSGTPDQQPGKGKSPDSARCGGVIDAAPDHDPAAKAAQDGEWEARVREAIAVETRRANEAGTDAGNLKRIAEQIGKARTDWRHELRNFIDDRSRQDYTFARPNRRMMASGFIFPSLVNDGMHHLGVSIDTSGSIDLKLLGQFAGQLQAAFDEGAADTLTVVYCDTRVHDVQTYQRGDVIKLAPASGGGTKFSPAIEWFEQNAPDVSAMIYFTDLDSDDFGDQPSFPIMWAVYGRPGGFKTPAFGDVIEVY